MFLFFCEADRIERECPNRRYVYERHPRKKLKLPLTDIKEVSAANRTDCEDRYNEIKKYIYMIKFILNLIQIKIFCYIWKMSERVQFHLSICNL